MNRSIIAALFATVYATAYMMSSSNWLQLVLITHTQHHSNTATPTPTEKKPPPSPTEKKPECRKLPGNFGKAIDLVCVSDPPKDAPKILCLVNTIEEYHHTRVKAILDTWGKKCSKLVVLSSESDPSINAVRIDNVHYDHDHLWEKVRAGIKYVYEQYGDEFDWFYKADDDAFVIMENLWSYLSSEEISSRHAKGEPLHLGHRFSLPQKYIVEKIRNHTLHREFVNQVGSDEWIYVSGGPGYAMNKAFIKSLVDEFDKPTCLSDPKYATGVSSDCAVSFCSAWFSAFPYDTRDKLSRQRWHALNPKGTYSIDPMDASKWYYSWHERIGGLKTGKDSISPESVAFHYIKPKDMRSIQHQLFECARTA